MFKIIYNTTWILNNPIPITQNGDKKTDYVLSKKNPNYI